MPCPNPHLHVCPEEKLSWVTPEMTPGAHIAQENESAHHSLQSIPLGILQQLIDAIIALLTVLLRFSLCHTFFPH